MSMKIKISKEQQQFTLNKINRLEQRMRSNSISPPTQHTQKKKIEPILILQNPAATLKISATLKSQETLKDITTDGSSVLTKRLKTQTVCKNLEEEFVEVKNRQNLVTSKKQRRKAEEQLVQLEQKLMLDQSKTFLSSTLKDATNFSTIEEQIALQKVAKNSRKITEFFSFTGDVQKISSQIEISKEKYDRHVDDCNYKLLIKKMKNNFKRKELQCLKYENEIYEYKQRIQNLETQSNTFTNSLKQLQDSLISKEKSFSQEKKKIEESLLENLLSKIKLENERNKNIIEKKKLTLGYFATRRSGHRFNKCWIEGTTIIEIRNQISELNTKLLKVDDQRKKVIGSTSKRYTSTIKNNTLLNSFIVQPDSSNQEASEKKNESLSRFSFIKMIMQKKLAQLTEKLKSLLIDQITFKTELKRWNAQEKQQPISFKIIFKAANSIERRTASRIGHFLKTGKGGFSEVYKAFDLKNMKWVACKIHQLQEGWSENVKNNYIKHALRENKIQTPLAHPNIVHLFDTLEVNNNSFCTVLEYCNGEDLKLFLLRNKLLHEREAKRIIQQLIAGINYLNNQKESIIHFDIKPQNILFHDGGIKIADFGLCKVMQHNEESKIHLTSQGVGTYWYLPPECFQQNSDPKISQKVDIFSIGVIFYEMLFGQKPFGHNMSQEKIYKDHIMLNAKVVSFPQNIAVSSEVKTIIRQMLEYDQDKRIGIKELYNHAYFKRR